MSLLIRHNIKRSHDLNTLLSGRLYHVYASRRHDHMNATLEIPNFTHFRDKIQALKWQVSHVTLTTPIWELFVILRLALAMACLLT